MLQLQKQTLLTRFCIIFSAVLVCSWWDFFNVCKSLLCNSLKKRNKCPSVLNNKFALINKELATLKIYIRVAKIGLLCDIPWIVVMMSCHHKKNKRVTDTSLLL